MSLTEKYCSLLAIEKVSSEEESVIYSQELDGLYEEIVNRPIHNLDDAKDKLKFALHCLGDVGDYIEAENLIMQVYRSLDRLNASVFVKKKTRIAKKLTSLSPGMRQNLVLQEDEIVNLDGLNDKFIA